MVNTLPRKRPNGGVRDPLWIDILVALDRYTPGAVFGAALGFYAVTRWQVEDPRVFGGVIAALAIIIAWLSSRGPWTFWEDTIHWISWWR